MLITLIPEVLGFRHSALKPFYMPRRVSLAETVSRDAENRNEGDHDKRGPFGKQNVSADQTPGYMQTIIII